MPPYEQFTVFPLDFVDDTLCPFQGMSDIMVVNDVVFHAEGAHARGSEVPLAEFIKHHPKTARQPTSGKRGGKSLVTDEELRQLWILFPWMSLEEIRQLVASNVHGNAHGGGGQAKPHAGGGQAKEAQDVEVVIHEEALAMLAAELQAKQNQLESTDQATAYFRVRLLGGQWSASRKGQAVSDIVCYPRPNDVSVWCSATAFPKAKSFSVRLYGHASALALAKGWEHKGEWFYGRWVQAGCPSPFSWEQIQGSYVPPSDFTEWFDAVAADSPAFHQGMALVNFVPNAVPA